MSPEDLRLHLQTLKDFLERSRKEVRAAQDLVDSEGWDLMYGMATDLMEEASRKMTVSVEMHDVYRAQGTYTGIMRLVNKVISLSEGKLEDGSTLEELEERYEREEEQAG